MRNTTCDQCGADVPADRCPECGAMTRAARRRWRESQYSPEDLVNHAVHEVGVPALGLLYLGVFNAAAGLFGAVIGLAAGGFRPDSLWAPLLGLYLLVSGVISFVAGLHMQKARHYALSIVGCVLCISGISPWCFLGVFIGAFGLYKLSRPKVRQGFAANRPDFDPDRV